MKYVRSSTLYSDVFVVTKKGSRAKSNGKWKSIAKCSTSRTQFLYSHVSSGLHILYIYIHTLPFETSGTALRGTTGFQAFSGI